MENFLSSRPSIAKLGPQPKTTAHLFSSLATRPAHHRADGLAPGDPSNQQPALEHLLPAHEPRVEVIREDGAVQRIIVVCKCGERIELDCVY